MICTPHQILFGERDRACDTYEGGGVVDCNDLIQDMNKSRALVNTLMKLSHKRRGTS